MEQSTTPLLGLTLNELKDVAKAMGMPAFAGAQMAKWLYTQHVSSIDDMLNISKANREKLKQHYRIGCLPPADCQKSVDGTIKYLFQRRAVSLSRRFTYLTKTAPRCACRRRWDAR